MKKFALLLTTLVFATTIWTSCDDEQTCDCIGDPPRSVGAIQIVIGSQSDTLHFIPGDPTSLSVPVTIIVTDDHGQVFSGIQVDVSLANPSFGAIEFIDDALLDTTNSLGRVETFFHTYGQAGDQTITATAEGVTTSRVLVIRESEGPVNTLSILATPAEIVADSNELAQTLITCLVVDASNRGIPNVLPDITFTGGWITAVTPTDSTGRSTFFWNFYNEFGFFTLRAQHGNLLASAEVEVRLREQEPEPYAGEYVVTSSFPDDTLWFLPGDSTYAPFAVTVYDTLGQRVPGVRVNIELANPNLGQIEFSDNYLRDTTNVNGMVNCVFRSYDVAGDQIIIPCVRENCAPIHFAIREIQPEPPQVDIHTIPATLRVDSNTVGEAFIVVTARDDNGILLPGITPTLSVQAGEFDPPPPTDANGESQTSWRFFNNFGAFQVATSIEYNGQSASDTTFINVLYGP